MFGCLSHVHVDSTNRIKHDPKPEKCFSIGYNNADFNYYFWDDQNLQ